MENNELLCTYCGCVLDESEMVTHDGENYCVSCFEENYTTCECCGETISNEYATYVERTNEFICENCYERQYRYCQLCGNIEPISNMNEVDYYGRDTNGYFLENESADICDACMNCLYFCEECDTYFEYDFYNHDNDMCNKCFEEKHGNEGYNCVAEYHFDVDWELYGKSEKRLGVELEVDRGDIDNDTAAARLNEIFNRHCVYERDSSLDNGFEIITHPHDEESFYSMPWHEAMKYLESSGYISHDAAQCGLHIHLNRKYFGECKDTQDTNIAKILVLYSRYWRFFLAMSRRTQEQADRYAKEYPNDDFETAMKNIKGYSSRYFAINNENHQTVEFRLGRGTLKVSSMFAWVDMHLAIAKNSNSIEESTLLDVAKWLKGIKPETLEYIKQMLSRSNLTFDDFEINEEDIVLKAE